MIGGQGESRGRQGEGGGRIVDAVAKHEEGVKVRQPTNMCTTSKIIKEAINQIHSSVRAATATTTTTTGASELNWGQTDETPKPRSKISRTRYAKSRSTAAASTTTRMTRFARGSYALFA